MPVHLIKTSLRISAITSNSYSPEGYVPKLTCAVMGPTPGCELVWTVQKPDGSDWLEARAEIPELAEEEGKGLEVALWGEEHEIADVGDCAFTLRAVNEIEGVDEALHTGTFTVVAASDTANDFAVSMDWMLPLGLITLDVDDDKDAPELVATAFLGGQVETHEIEAHLFVEGKKVAQSTSTNAQWGNQGTAGTAVGTEVTFEFDTVRAWNNIRESDPTWRQDDHWMDVNPGAYEVRVARGKKLVRTIAFGVGDDGRVVITDGRIEPDVLARPVAWFAAEAKGDLDGTAVDPAALERAAYGGDLATSALVWDLKGMYWFQKLPEAADPDALDEATAAALAAVVDDASNLLGSWEADLAEGPESALSPSEFVNKCELAVIPGVDAYEAARAALDLPDDHAVTVLDDATTLGEATARVLALRAAATAHVQAISQGAEDVLTPFRAVLANDKLAIFEDHPAPGFEYLTSNKELIETPEELAEAEYWYFEGVLDLDAEAEIDGEAIKGKVKGWRVLGYRFDDDGNTVDEWEERGTGSSSPKSAYQHHEVADAEPAKEPAAKKKAAKKKAPAKKAPAKKKAAAKKK
jgi:hypothetical protein